MNYTSYCIIIRNYATYVQSTNLFQPFFDYLNEYTIINVIQKEILVYKIYYLFLNYFIICLIALSSQNYEYL